MSDLADMLTAESCAGCCGDASWRGRLCSYHRGFQDGADAMVQALGENFPLER